MYVCMYTYICSYIYTYGPGPLVGGAGGSGASEEHQHLLSLLFLLTVTQEVAVQRIGEIETYGFRLQMLHDLRGKRPKVDPS